MPEPCYLSAGAPLGIVPLASSRTPAQEINEAVVGDVTSELPGTLVEYGHYSDEIEPQRNIFCSESGRNSCG